MMNRFAISRFMSGLKADPPAYTIRLFMTVIYGVVLVNTLFLLPMAGEIWGSSGLSNAMPHPDTLMYHLLFILMNPMFADYYPVVIGIQIIAVLLWFAGRYRRAAALLVFLSTSILYNAAHLYVTGGHTLIKLFLFYFIFMAESPGGPIRNALTNIMLLACKVQLAVLYFFAALYKWNGTYWVNGEALYYVLSIREFSHPLLQDWLLNHPVLLKVATWIGLLYQSLFPFLIWFKQTKVPLLLVGIFFHLFIAFGMGLPDFGIFMVLSYTMFVSNRNALRVSERIRNRFFAKPLRIE